MIHWLMELNFKQGTASKKKQKRMHLNVVMNIFVADDKP